MKGMIKMVEDYRTQHAEIFAKALSTHERWLRENPDYVASLPQDLVTKTTDTNQFPTGPVDVSDIKDEDIIINMDEIAAGAAKKMAVPWPIELGPNMAG